MKASSLLLILAAASIAAAYAYFSMLPAQSGPQASIESQPLKLTIKLDKTHFQQGENVTINISAENTSNQTIKITFPMWYLYYDFEQNKRHIVYFDFVIVDENGTEVWRWSRMKGALFATYDVVLGAGEQLNNTFVWDQDIGVDDAVQIPAGTYHMRAAMPAGRSSAFDIDGGSKGVSLETPSIMFTVG